MHRAPPLWRRRPAVLVLAACAGLCVVALLLFNSGRSDHASSPAGSDDELSPSNLLRLQRPGRSKYGLATTPSPRAAFLAASVASADAQNRTPSPPYNDGLPHRDMSDCNPQHHQTAACIAHDGALILPYGYPVHRNLPKRAELLAGIEAQRTSRRCDATDLLLRSPLVNPRPPVVANRNEQQQQQQADDDDGEGGRQQQQQQQEQRDSVVQIADEAALRRSFESQFATPLRDDRKLFAATAKELADAEAADGGEWWVRFGDSGADEDAARLPCTAEVQALLHRWQHPPEAECTAGGGGGDSNDPDLGHAGSVRGLVSELKAGAHGVGSAITLLAHDFLNALIVRRRFTVMTRGSKKWFFAPQGCSGGGWECLFVPPTSCHKAWSSARIPVHKIGDISRVGNKRLVMKKTFDIPGLSRSDFPSVERFFDTLLDLQRSERSSFHHGGTAHDRLAAAQLAVDEQQEQRHREHGAVGAKRKSEIVAKCVPLIKTWAADPANRMLMGTFRKGADPLLAYQLAQVTAYLLRGLQPWFRHVVAAHLRNIVLGAPSRQAALREVAAGRGGGGHNRVRRGDKRSEEEERELIRAGRLPKKQQHEDGNGNGNNDGGGGGVGAVVLERGPDGVLQRARDAGAERGEEGGAGGHLEEEVQAVVFVHDRGELAKYREYYNSFGCHKLKQEALLREVDQFLCPAATPAAAAAAGDAAAVAPPLLDVDVTLPLVTATAAAAAGGGQSAKRIQQQQHLTVKKGKCVVFVSGNMPHAEYEEIVDRFRSINAARRHDPNHFQLVVRSTWELQTGGGGAKNINGGNNNNHNKAAETERWGAAHPAASWVDLFAGMHSTAWTCIAQSNWCRVVGFLRATLLARAQCPFVDMGIAALADDEIPHKYCTVRSDWPMKPYSGVQFVRDLVVP